MPRYVRAHDLAPVYLVTPQTILAWARRGIIPSVRATQRPVLFDPAEVDRVIRERRRHPDGGPSNAA